MAGKLMIARHHQSEYNKRGLWTGLHDPPLDEYGAAKSLEMGELIRDVEVHRAYSSALTRTKETLIHMLGDRQPAIEHAPLLNERDYGEFTGKNKWEVLARIGEEQFKKLRRSWDHPVPGGESLRMVHDRAVPFYLATIVPYALVQNVLVVGHGNTLRALLKHIESISDEEIADVEMPFGAVFVYTINQDGRMCSKEIRATNSDVPA
jgi:2,3-bisphosphoglycerate-dependent phosphoglycerate mutase